MPLNFNVPYDPEGSFKAGSDFVNRMVDLRAQSEAGAQYAAGDLAGAANTFARYGMLDKATTLQDTVRKQKNEDEDRKLARFKAGQDYLKTAMPVLGAVYSQKGAEGLADAWTQLTPDLQAHGVEPGMIEQVGGALRTNPDGALRALDGLAKIAVQKDGNDMVGLDPTTGKEVWRTKGPAKPPDKLTYDEGDEIVTKLYNERGEEIKTIRAPRYKPAAEAAPGTVGVGAQTVIDEAGNQWVFTPRKPGEFYNATTGQRGTPVGRIRPYGQAGTEFERTRERLLSPNADPASPQYYSDFVAYQKGEFKRDPVTGQGYKFVPDMREFRPPTFKGYGPVPPQEGVPAPAPAPVAGDAAAQATPAIAQAGPPQPDQGAPPPAPTPQAAAPPPPPPGTPTLMKVEGPSIPPQRTIRVPIGSEYITYGWDPKGGQWKDMGHAPRSLSDLETPWDDNAIKYAAETYKQTGQLPPLGTGRFAVDTRRRIISYLANTGTPVAEAVMNAVADQADLKANRAALTTQVRFQSQVRQFEETARKNADLALETGAKGIGPSSIPLFNAWVQAGRRGFGSSDVRNFDIAVTTFLQEYAKVMQGQTGAGGTTDAARKEAERLIQTTDNWETFKGAVATLKREMANRDAAIEEGVQTLRGKLRGKGLGVVNQPKTNERDDLVNRWLNSP